jgi:hypothetical protein
LPISASSAAKSMGYRRLIEGQIGVQVAEAASAPNLQGIQVEICVSMLSLVGGHPMSDEAGKPRPPGRGAITVFRTALVVTAASTLLLLLMMLLAFRTTPAARVVVREPAVAGPERVVEPVRVESERVTLVDLLPQRVTKVERVNVAVEKADAVSEPTDEPRSKWVNDSFCARYGLHKVVTRGGRSWRCQK